MDSATLRVLAAPDKFRGSLTGPEVTSAIAEPVRIAGGLCVQQPLADGGEGMVDAFGGANRTSTVTGPAGTPVEAAWRFDDEQKWAIIESAAASGLDIAGGAEGNDPVNATSAGTGQLIAQALAAGARRVIVGLGGSAMTDGGIGTVEAVIHDSAAREALETAELLVACDVQARFTEAARIFGPQKGATPQQIEELTYRLELLQEDYAHRFEIDLRDVAGGGAAGGLGGGLVALGGQLVPGLDLVADHVGLSAAIQEADLVVTGEGKLDAESFNGKVVGGVIERARAAGLPVLVVAGTVVDGTTEAGALAAGDVTVVDLSATYGPDNSWQRPAWCIGQAVGDYLARTPLG